MRKAAEAGDDFVVAAGVVEVAFAAGVFGGQRGEQGERALLVGERFAVFEGQVDEEFFDG